MLCRNRREVAYWERRAHRCPVGTYADPRLGALPHLITVTEPCGRWCSGSRRTIAGWRSRALGRRIVGRRRPPTPPHPQPLNQGRSKIREELACYAPQNSGLRCLHVNAYHLPRLIASRTIGMDRTIGQSSLGPARLRLARTEQNCDPCSLDQLQRSPVRSSSTRWLEPALSWEAVCPHRCERSQ